MRILLWHVHGSWTTAFVQGGHEYLVPVTPDRGPYGLGRARTYPWPESVREVIGGLSRLSHTVASRDAQLASLLSKARKVTQVLVDREHHPRLTAAAVLAAHVVTAGCLGRDRPFLAGLA